MYFLSKISKASSFVISYQRYAKRAFYCVHYFMLFLFHNTLFGQEKMDTIQFKTFTVVDYTVSENYTTTKMDSVAVASSENLADLLQHQSTVFVKTYGAGSLASVSFRGTGASHTRVLWNDVEINSPMNGQIDFSLFPSFFFNTAELHHGASGLIDGNGALGGSVLMKNTSPSYTSTTHPFSLTYFTSIGSFGKKTNGIKIAFNQKKDWFFETHLYHSLGENDFTFKNISQKNHPEDKLENGNYTQYGFQQAIYKKIKNNTLGLRFWYFNSDRNLASAMIAEDAKENQKDESFRTLLEWKGYTKKWSYKLSSSFIKDNLVYENKSIGLVSNNQAAFFSNALNTTYFITNSSSLINTFKVRYEYADADGIEGVNSRFNSSWLSGYTKNFKAIEVNIFNRMTIVDAYQNLFAPSISAGYTLPKIKKLLLKASWGINYNYPTFNDLYWNPGGNPDLLPEKATMSEIGLKYRSKQTKNFQITAEANGFYSLVDNWIIWQPTSSSIWSPTNLKKVENKGIETNLSLSKKVNQLQFSFKGKYAFTKSTNIQLHQQINESLNKQLIYVPEHQFNYMLEIGLKNTQLTYNYRYTSLRYISTDNNWYLPANFISDVALSQKINLSENTKLQLSFRVNNLFNQTYQSIAWRPMPLRNYLFNLTFQL